MQPDGVRVLLHGVIVERDSESRDLLVRVLAGLDWTARVFGDLVDADLHLPKAWAVFVGSEDIGDADPQAVRRLRRRAPETVIVLIQALQDEQLARRYQESGADVVLARPLAEPAVIDAVGKALISRRR